jgi:hypothetical protein
MTYEAYSQDYQNNPASSNNIILRFRQHQSSPIIVIDGNEYGINKERVIRNFSINISRGFHTNSQFDYANFFDTIIEAMNSAIGDYNVIYRRCHGTGDENTTASKYVSDITYNYIQNVLKQGDYYIQKYSKYNITLSKIEEVMSCLLGDAILQTNEYLKSKGIEFCIRSEDIPPEDIPHTCDSWCCAGGVKQKICENKTVVGIIGVGIAGLCIYKTTKKKKKSSRLHDGRKNKKKVKRRV